MSSVEVEREQSPIATSASTREFWNPPSQAIQKLFEIRSSETPVVEVEPTTGFSEEELSKLPSTLVKVIRKMNTLQGDLEKQKRMVADTNAEIKTVNQLLTRYSKKFLKQQEKDIVHSKKNPRGFACPSKVSDALCDFMGKPRGSKISRTETSAFLSRYIEDKGLQDPNKKSVIVPDATLTALFGEEAILSEEFNYFSMQKHLTPHFLR